MKPKSNSFFGTPTKQQPSSVLLPNTLANRILDIELEMQQAKINKDLIIELLQLYSEAMSFYEEHNDPKYKIFEQRIHNLLKKSQISEVINGKTAENSCRDKQVAEGRSSAERSAKQQAKAIIKYYNSEIDKQADRIQKDLETQKQKILERVRTRSASKGKINPQTPDSKSELKASVKKMQSLPVKAPKTSMFLDEMDLKLPIHRLNKN